MEDNQNLETQNLENVPSSAQDVGFCVPNYKLTPKEQEILNDSTAYAVKLDNFEGPLDLLLYLIKETKVDIEDIRLSMITEQYLDYMKEIDTLDMEKAAEFIEVAATLLEIKSKYLIPQEKELMDEDPENKERLLLQKLKEYKLFKEASEKLQKIENLDHFYKRPDETCNDYRIVLKQMNMQNLITAFTKLLSKVNLEQKQEEVKTIERDRFTVEEKIFEIETIILKQEKISFFELCDESFSRSEIITTFSALLELLKLQKISVVQEEMFGDILITKKDEQDDDFVSEDKMTF